MQSVKKNRYKTIKTTAMQRKESARLSVKTDLKQRSGLNTDKELSESIDLIMDVLNDCPTSDDVMDFMKIHNVVLPSDKIQRIEILINNAENVLPRLHEDNPQLEDYVLDIIITLGALGRELDNYAGTDDDCKLPEDELIEEICLIFSAEEKPKEDYYIKSTELVSKLINRLKQSMQNNECVIINAIGYRLALQSVQYDQLYRFYLAER